VPTRPTGVYPDSSGGWYYKARLPKDPITGRHEQITRRGFRTAVEAGKARRELIGKVDKGELRSAPTGITVSDLLDLYLDGLDADQRLSEKTRYDYRHSTEDYVRPHLGNLRLRDVTPDAILAWQRKLTKEGGTKRKKDADGKLLHGKGLSPNTVRLARSPLAGAFKLAMSSGMITINPVAQIPRPRPARSIPKHWSPEQAREFLALMEGDRTWPIWAFLLGTGLRIGELVWLRWPNVGLPERRVRIVDFAATLGHDLLPSKGKSHDAVRTIDLDDGLVNVLKRQRSIQAAEKLAAIQFEDSEYVFTKPEGGAYHPQRVSRVLGVYSQELGLPRLTAHGLRHTSATLMLASGVSPKVAAERLGHSDASLFTNLYSHVTPTMQRDAADRIGEALFGSSVADPQ
jgi:integrase